MGYLTLCGYILKGGQGRHYKYEAEIGGLLEISFSFFSFFFSLISCQLLSLQIELNADIEGPALF